jgi:Leucine-rich repeat (LRR) protein
MEHPNNTHSICVILSLKGYLNVYRNQLTGSIPRYMKDLSKLFLLDLGHNQVTGTLPAEIGGKNTALKHLHLDHNQFVGTIPPSYTQYGMETLSLDHNQLVGSVPSDYSSMSELGTC